MYTSKATTKLLLHCEGSDGSTKFIDETGKVGTVSGNLQIDTAQYKYGLASGLGDGTGDYLTFDSHADFAIGTGDFTFDCWLRFAVNTGLHGIFRINSYNNGIELLHRFDTGNINFYIANTEHNVAWSPSINTWYHFAITRSSGTIRLYVGGSQIGSDISDAGNIQQGAVELFGNSRTGSYFNGWQDEIRLLKGEAAWTTAFTPPTSGYNLPNGKFLKFF